MMNRFALSVFPFFLLVQALPAQYHPVGYPSIINFEKADYRAGTQTWAAVQGEGGIMYFGNNKGVLEFDGTTWRVFPLPNRTIARSLAFGKDGRLYVGGQDEMGFLESDAAGYITYTSLAGQAPEAYRSFEDVWKIFPREDGVFFCAQKVIFRLADGQMEAIAPAGRFEYYFESGGELFVLDSQEGLLQWDGRRFQLVPQGETFKNKGIAAILPFEQGRRLLVSVSEGLFLMDATGIRPWKVKASNFLMEYRTYCAYPLTDGRYAIGTTQNGLLIINRQGDPLMHLNKASGLQNNTVLCIFEDQLHNLWLALDNGIDYVEISSPFSIIRSKTGVEGTGYTSIVHDGNLYLGTNQGLFRLNWNAPWNPFAPESFSQVENTKGQAWCLNKLDGNLMMGHHEGAFLIQDNQAIQLSGIKGAWKFLELENAPGLAIEGAYSGLLLYERQPGPKPGWKFLKKLEGFDESARVIEQDNEGYIWVSHAYKGLYRIRLGLENRAIAEVDFFNSRQGLPTGLFINVAKLRGELVFTTPLGIYAFDKANGRFQKHEEFSRIFGDGRNIHRLLEDESGNIWFSIDEEFGVLKIQEKGVFNQVEKLYFNQIQDVLVDGFEHVYAPDPHNVFIATEKGFIHYNPSSSGEERLPFQALLRSVWSTKGQDSLMWAGGLSGQAVPEVQKRPQVFPSAVNAFRFSFSAPFYMELKHIQYRYQLDGFENSWSDWGYQAEKEYTNLPYGDYTFRVEARNAFGQISAPAAYAFVITPPWYATALAKIAYLLMGAAAILGLAWSNRQRLAREKAILEEEQARTIQEKEAEFRQEVEKSEAEIVELRNEKLRADINHKNSQLASATMHLVQKGEMLLKIKNDLNKLLGNAAAENQRKIRQLIKTIDEDIRHDNNWGQFEVHFDQVHEDFLKRLREQYPALTPKDQKLCAYLRMNLSTKEIAPLMNISVRGVEISRYRLRKKLELDSDDNLVDFIMKV